MTPGTAAMVNITATKALKTARRVNFRGHISGKLGLLHTGFNCRSAARRVPNPFSPYDRCIGNGPPYASRNQWQLI
jgi:hypothetical protein